MSTRGERRIAAGSVVAVLIALSALVGPVGRAAAQEAPTSTQPVRIGAIFELVDLVGLREIFDRGPGDPVVDAISADYGSTWDEWTTTWANHHPGEDLDAALATLDGVIVVPVDEMAHAATIFETSTPEEMEALFARGPGDADYDLIAEEYGEDLDEWLRLWDIHNPELAAARAAAADGDDDRAPLVIAGIGVLVLAAGVLLVLRRRTPEVVDPVEPAQPEGFRFDR